MGWRWRIAQSFSRRKQQIAACCRCQATSIIINVHHQLLLCLPACLLPRAHLTHPPPRWLLHANCQFPRPTLLPALSLADLQAATFGIARLQRWQRVIFHHQQQQQSSSVIWGPAPASEREQSSQLTLATSFCKGPQRQHQRQFVAFV